jgi:hypothetical protein
MIGSLSSLGNSSVPAGAGEVRLFSVVRNEAPRLPYFLRYYSERGVDRFFIVDNDSTDSTSDVLLGHKHVHVFYTSEKYSQSRYGAAWLETLLAQYGRDHWCVVADADEFVVYPGWEYLSIPQLCQYFDLEQASAFHCILVDMYSDRPFDQTEYIPGTNPLKTCPYFETDTIQCVGSLRGVKAGHWRHRRGVRGRLFDLTVRLDKISLIKYDPAMTIEPGMHFLRNVRLSRIRGAVLHFKFLGDFSTRVAIEASRGEHWSNAIEYKRYAEVVALGQPLCAYTSSSQRFRGSKDLIDAGVMTCPADFSRYCSQLQVTSAVGALREATKGAGTYCEGVPGLRLGSRKT